MIFHIIILIYASVFKEKTFYKKCNQKIFFLLSQSSAKDIILVFRLTKNRMSLHQRDEIRWNKRGYFERYDGKKYWRKLCIMEGCTKRAKVIDWCKLVSRVA